MPTDSAPNSSEDQPVCVAAIAGAFGVRGEVRLKPFTNDPEAVAGYGPLSTEDGARQFEVRLSRPIKGGYAVRLSSVATREEAEALKGTRLYVPRSALPEPEDEGDYYYADLIGMDVEDLSGHTLGRVRAVQNFGAGDFLEIYAPGRRQTALLPFTLAAVPKVDLARRTIIADPPLGVFEDAPDDDARDGAKHD
ncbi:MAG: ribosome maturation factor RimM [Pseudomonadota bacterium]